LRAGSDYSINSVEVELRPNLSVLSISKKYFIFALNLVYEWLDLHRSDLLSNWKKMEKHQALLKIDPLS
jgi:hypothetical protein